MTWETMTGAGESGAINTDNISGTEIGGKTTTGETITGTAIIDSPATIAQENELKEKIKTLIEKRKIDSKPATKLTEEDIQLMTDVLQTIVDETKSK